MPSFVINIENRYEFLDYKINYNLFENLFDCVT